MYKTLALTLFFTLIAPDYSQATLSSESPPDCKDWLHFYGPSSVILQGQEPERVSYVTTNLVTVRYRYPSALHRECLVYFWKSTGVIVAVQMDKLDGLQQSWLLLKDLTYAYRDNSKVNFSRYAIGEVDQKNGLATVLIIAMLESLGETPSDEDMPTTMLLLNLILLRAS